MSFLFPSFLFALGLVTIPIAIHLFNFRKYQKVYFTNVRFLKEIKKETNRQAKLKHLLVLFARILALIFIVLAFAQPYIPNKENSQMSSIYDIVSIYLDNSLSMEAGADNRSLLEQAKDRAVQVVNAHDYNTKYNLITNEFKGKHQKFYSKDQMINMIDEVALSPTTRMLSEVYKKQNNIDKVDDQNIKSYWISDFQKSIIDLDTDNIDSTLKGYMLPLSNQAINNIYIDSCWLEKPYILIKEPIRLIVRMKCNQEDNSKKGRVELKINGQTKGIAEYDFKAITTYVDTLTFSVDEAGWYKAMLSIEDFPVTFDDQYFFTFKVSESYKVLAIKGSEESPYLNAFYRNKKYFNYQEVDVNQLDFSIVEEHQLVILNDLRNISSGLIERIESYISKGGTVLFIPSLEADINSYNQFSKRMSIGMWNGLNNIKKKVSRINTSEYIYSDVFEDLQKNVDMPYSLYNYAFSYEKYGGEPIMQYEDGSAFIVKNNYKKGQVYIVNAPLGKEYSNFATHSLFVPFLYKVTLSGTRSYLQAYEIGIGSLVEIKGTTLEKDQVYKVRNNEVEFIPEYKYVDNRIFLDMKTNVKTAGFYEYYLDQNSIDGSGWLAFNYSRTESDLNYLDEVELKELAGKVGFSVLSDASGEILVENIKQLNKGIVLWKWCIILALLFLGAEVLLLRFWK